MASKKETLKKKVNPKITKKKESHSNQKQKSNKNKASKKINSVNKPKVNKSVTKIQKKEIEVHDFEQISVNKATNKNKTVLKNRIKSFIKYLNKRKWILLLSFLVIVLATLIITNLKNATKKIFLTFKPYSIGEQITLKDNSNWYVIEESSSGENIIKLLSANVIDLNDDGKIDDKDKKAFDSSNSCEYNTKNDKNIGYFLENKYIDKLDKLTGIKEIRLLTSEEYISIRKAMDFGYDWKEENWLAGETLGVWWLETCAYKKLYAVTERGSYRLSNASSKNYVRPVIVIDKENIK